MEDNYVIGKRYIGDESIRLRCIKEVHHYVGETCVSIGYGYFVFDDPGVQQMNLMESKHPKGWCYSPGRFVPIEDGDV